MGLNKWNQGEVCGGGRGGGGKRGLNKWNQGEIIQIS